jgi:hypothetical protein
MSVSPLRGELHEEPIEEAENADRGEDGGDYDEKGV